MGRQHYLAMAMAMERGAQKQVLSEDHVVTTFRLRSDFVRVDVVNAQDGSQKIVVDTDRPGRLILHWGVVGGPEYKVGCLGAVRGRWVSHCSSFRISAHVPLPRLPTAGALAGCRWLVLHQPS